jgi:catechol 2,3-dioxygenase-like lactoylglutathione lyase family enzyme
MELGRFSVSLNVKDLRRSMAFYEMLGFAQVFGEPEDNWVILASGEAKIGLFQGMLESNYLTFNPIDARAIQAVIQEAGYPIEKEAEPGDGPAHLMLKDPDGNTILIDQHS